MCCIMVRSVRTAESVHRACVAFMLSRTEPSTVWMWSELPASAEAAGLYTRCSTRLLIHSSRLDRPWEG